MNWNIVFETTVEVWHEKVVVGYPFFIAPLCWNNTRLAVFLCASPLHILAFDGLGCHQ